MRIISGLRKGKKIVAPSNLPVRPTTDFAKEALFSIIQNHFDIEEISVLDLYAGTGNISYEFASRGALDIVSIDSNQACVNFIAKTALQLEFYQIKALKTDALHFLRTSRIQRDIIFADPPFDDDITKKIPEIVFEEQLLNAYGWLIVEHSSRISFGDNELLFDMRKYGSVCFSFFKQE